MVVGTIGLTSTLADVPLLAGQLFALLRVLRPGTKPFAEAEA
jgi:hypothetical protein